MHTHQSAVRHQSVRTKSAHMHFGGDTGATGLMTPFALSLHVMRGMKAKSGWPFAVFLRASLRRSLAEDPQKRTTKEPGHSTKGGIGIGLFG